jgi:hypothetical protein
MQCSALPCDVLIKTYLIVILMLTLMTGSIVLNNDNTVFAKKQPVNNGPAALGFRPETTHCGDLDTSATGGQNYDDGYDQGYVDAHRDFRGLNGHGFDDSVNHGSSEYKSGYVRGYADGWTDAQKGIQDPKC